jgi:hypothetical protein
MSALVASFPVLHEARGVDPWNATEFARWAAKWPASEASKNCARFVLSVWSPGTRWKVGRFDVVAAMSRWDHTNKAAFVAWARDPWWP